MQSISLLPLTPHKKQCHLEIPCKISFQNMYTFPMVAYIIIEKIKGIFSDSNNIFLWHESEDKLKKKKNLYSKISVYSTCTFTSYA